MQLREVAAISGKTGLYQILKPTRGGVIVEALDGSGAREAVGASQRLSILSEISMYVTTEEGSEPLGNIFAAIVKKHGAKPLALNAKSDGSDLEAFFAEILPDWDSDRVYLSDIKKLVTWYNILVQCAPEVLTPETETATAPETEEGAAEAKPAAKAKSHLPHPPPKKRPPPPTRPRKPPPPSSKEGPGLRYSL